MYSGFHSYLYDSYFLYLQATVGVVTTGRYSTRLLYLVFIRTKVSVTLPILDKYANLHGYNGLRAPINTHPIPVP